MKKAVTFLAVIGIILSFSACSNSHENVDSSKKPTESQITSSVLESTPNNESQSTLLSKHIYKVPLKNIYINTPRYQDIEQGYTELYIVHDKKYVAITAQRKETATTPEEAHNIAFNEFKQNIQTYSYVNDLSIVNDSTKKINELDVYEFEGTMNCGHDTKMDAYALGYSFLMDGVPCEIIGSVIDKSQSQDLKNEIKSVVEAMVKSVRTTE